MRVVLLSVAALLAATALPAAAAEAQDLGFTGGASQSFRGGFGSGHGTKITWGQGRHDRRRHSRHGFGGDVYFGDREYQGDTVWRAESYNDWWHERPHRSYPAWVTRNQDCQRQWWSGDSLRC